MRIYVARNAHHRVAFDEMSIEEKHDRLFIEDREEDVRRKTLANLSANQIARELHINTRSVIRIRARLRQRGDLP